MIEKVLFAGVAALLVAIPALQSSSAGDPDSQHGVLRASKIELRSEESSKGECVTLEATEDGHLLLLFGETEKPRAELHFGDVAGAFAVNLTTIDGGSLSLRLAEDDTMLILTGALDPACGAISLHAGSARASVNVYDNSVASGTGTELMSRECTLGAEEGSGFIRLGTRQGYRKWIDVLRTKTAPD